MFFLTICGLPHGHNQFATHEAWRAVRDADEFFHQHRRWHVRLPLAMPDHLHLLVTFPRQENLERVVSAWKRFLAGGSAGIVWQRDFFDHRVRSHESLDEKAAYIRANPVRAGLVARPQDWPFAWSPPDLVATPFR